MILTIPLSFLTAFDYIPRVLFSILHVLVLIKFTILQIFEIVCVNHPIQHSYPPIFISIFSSNFLIFSFFSQRITSFYWNSSTLIMFACIEYSSIVFLLIFISIQLEDLFKVFEIWIHICFLTYLPVSFSAAIPSTVTQAECSYFSIF